MVHPPICDDMSFVKCKRGSLISYLQSENLEIVDVPGDGHCLLRAFLFYLRWFVYW